MESQSRVNISKQYGGLRIPLYRDVNGPILDVPPRASYLNVVPTNNPRTNEVVFYKSYSDEPIAAQVLEGLSQRDLTLLLENMLN